MKQEKVERWYLSGKGTFRNRYFLLCNKYIRHQKEYIRVLHRVTRKLDKLVNFDLMIDKNKINKY